AAGLDGHRANGVHDLGDQRGLTWGAGEGPVEIDDVQSLRAGRRPALGHRHRIVGEHGAGVVTPLEEPHAAALAQIDGRDEDHRTLRAPLALTMAAKFSRSRMPAPRPLFSGWNCVA